MSRSRWGSVPVTVVLSVALLALTGGAGPVREPLRAPGAAAAPRPASAQLPWAFEANVGQSDPQVRFLARRSHVGFFLTTDQAVLTLRGSDVTTGAAVRMAAVGSDPHAETVGVEALEGRVNHLRGPRPEGWHTYVPTYAKVAQRGVWPGIDLVYYGSGQDLEYDVVVAPGADPATVRFEVQGATAIRVDERGDLVVDTDAGPLVQRRPVAYQPHAAGRQVVNADYVLHGDQVGLRLGAYDPARPLVVDPVLAYSTYLGGGGFDLGAAIAVDGTGAAYVTGRTSAPDFPTTVGAFDPSANSDNDVFVAKLDPAGSALAYATYLGGDGFDDGLDIVVDGTGAAYVSGRTASSDFPTTAGALDTTANGGEDGFVAKLDPSGSALAYATYLGGTGSEALTGIAVDESGAAYVTGGTGSADFPATPGAFDATLNGAIDVVAAKLDPAGSTLAYATYLGGTGLDAPGAVAVDGSGAAYVVGTTDAADFPTTAGAFDPTRNCCQFDAFVVKVTPAGSSLTYATYLGGTGHDSASGVAVDGAGAAYVTGSTTSHDFPTTPDAFDTTVTCCLDDVFVAKMDPTGSGLAYATYVGGSLLDFGTDIAVDGTGAAYVSGTTGSEDFPTTPLAPDPDFRAGEGFAFKLDPEGSTLAYATFLGGSGFESAVGIALDATGAAYVTGATTSGDFPTTPGANDTTYDEAGLGDAFVVKLAPSSPPLSDCDAAPPPGTLPGNTIVITAPGVVTLGTPGDDVVYGTDGVDRVAGLAGNDVVFGMTGGDQLVGGDGDDTLCGGEGDDQLVAGAGDDQLSGDGGNDALVGDLGDDALHGGSGTDRLSGGSGADICTPGGEPEDQAAPAPDCDAVS